MTLSRHHESNNDQEQGKTGSKHLQEQISRQQTNVGTRRDDRDQLSQTRTQTAAAKTVTCSGKKDSQNHHFSIGQLIKVTI